MIKVFRTEDTRVKNVDIVPLKITSPIKTIIIEAICTPTICSNVLTQDVKTVSSNYEHLKRIELADSSPEITKCIDVLMGVHYYYSCITGKVKRGKDYEPIVINSCFGWVVCGYYEQPFVSANFVNSAHMLRTNTELLNKFEEIKTENTFNDDLKKLFHAENYEEEINDDVYLSFKKNLRFDNKKERYETKILPENYSLANHRLSSLKNRLSNNDLFHEYDKIIKDYIKEDIIEIVPPSEEIVLPGSAHYLPHRTVVKENRETTKVRIVFDGSAHSLNKPSINDVLYSRPWK